MQHHGHPITYRASTDHPKAPQSGERGTMKLKEPQVAVRELFIYTFISCSCFTVSVIKINNTN